MSRVWCFNFFWFLELYQMSMEKERKTRQKLERAICFIHRSRSSFDGPSSSLPRLPAWALPWTRLVVQQVVSMFDSSSERLMKNEGNIRDCVEFLLAAGRCCGGDCCPGNVRMFFIWKWLELFFTFPFDLVEGNIYVLSSFHIRKEREREKNIVYELLPWSWARRDDKLPTTLERPVAKKKRET